MRCRRCGEEVPEDSSFCIFCGERLEREGGGAPLSFQAQGGAPPSRGDGPGDLEEGTRGEPPHRGREERRFASVAGEGEEGAPAGVYLPPEADLAEPAAVTGMPAEPFQPAGEEEPGAEEMVADRTVAMTPVPAEKVPPGPPRTSVRTLICPECYAENPVFNRFCHECGNPLPSLPVGPPAPGVQESVKADVRQKTMVIPAPPQPAYGEAGAPEPAPAREKERGGWLSSFGPADLLCALALVAGALTLTPVFRWKKGLEFGIFSHQGSFLPGSTGLFSGTRALGGPGILPYRGWEFLTAGFVIALALGLAFTFMLLRVGRGPMYLISGCVALFPFVYVLFQGILPLRQHGISISRSIGIGQVLFGGEGNAGAGPALWVSVGAGVLLVLAGFVAPPRGWGRLFTFLVFAPLVVLAAFFCAACYNWNLFIAGKGGAGLFAALAPTVSVMAPVCRRGWG